MTTKLFITGGIHGDEPSGAAALPLLRERGFACFGPCNPWGCDNNRRELPDGRDLNRCFARRNCPQAHAVREAVTTASPQLLIDLHEDGGATRPYFIQFGPGHDIAARLVKSLRDRYEFEPHPRSSVVRGRAGIIKPSRFLLFFVGLSRRWPLAYWFWRTTARPGIVVEAPGQWPLERRIEFHMAAAQAATLLA